MNNVTQNELDQELLAFARSFETFKHAKAENTELRGRAERSEHRAEIAESENENLRQMMKRANAERDHYFRAFTALSAQLDLSRPV